MAVYFLTDKPSALLKSFNDRIEQTEQKGKITTWEKHSGGQHFGHKSPNWKGLAFFKPRIDSDRLTFNIIRPKDKTVSVKVYGYYHGHLIETFLNHFDELFSVASASGLATDGDDVK